MKSFTKDILIPPDRKVILELPEEVPPGRAVLTLTFETKAPSETLAGKNGIASLRGLGKGKVWMSDDSNAPLEDFAEQIETNADRVAKMETILNIIPHAVDLEESRLERLNAKSSIRH